MYTIIHAVIGYFFLIFIVRVLSRRPGAQMTPFEFVIVFLIGGIIILATVGNDRSQVNSVCAVITIGMLHRLVSTLRVRYPKIALLVDGTPLLAYKGDQSEREVMKHMRLEDMDLMAAARTKGIKLPSGIKYAVLERNGAISIFKKED